MTAAERCRTGCAFMADPREVPCATCPSRDALTVTSTLWAEIPNGRWQLRVSDEHWFIVYGSEVILAPMGIRRATCASHEAAKREAERQYRASLESMVKRGERLVMEGRAGLAALDKGASRV